MDEHRIRVLLADDHNLVRAGIAQLLSSEQDMVVVGEAADGVQAYNMAVQTRPDIILMDLNMPRSSGFEAIAHIRAAFPDAIIVVLTYSESEKDIAEAVRAGAQGYLLKSSEPETLASSIREAYRGESPMSGIVLRKLLVDLQRAEPAPSSPPSASQAPPVYAVPEASARMPLTARELEILTRVAQGETNREIGLQLFLSENTVKNHLKHILTKLQVENRAQAVAWAMGEGLLARRL